MTEKTTTKEFPIEGMSCASCALSVEKALARVPGVQKAGVNFTSNSAVVEFSPSSLSIPDLKKAVENIGYHLIADESSISPEHENHHTSAGENQHTRALNLTNRFVISAILSAPVFVIGMFLMHMPYGNYISLVLTTGVMIMGGAEFFPRAWKLLLHRSANMDTLVALGTGAAFLFSTVNTLIPEILRSRGMEPHVFFESAAVVITLVLLGRLLEEQAKYKTTEAIRELIGLQPLTARVRTQQGDRELAVASLKLGDSIVIRPGERIPVDGKVTEGNSYIDESMITGEPMPVLKEAGEKVVAGTINQEGSFVFEAEQVGESTLLARIIAVVKQAQASKAPIQGLADKIASVFVPVVMLVSLLTLTAWTIWGGENGFTQGIVAAVTVLVVACPCALGLATPTAIMVGIGKAATSGILIKDANSIEMLRKTNVLVVDKTGTLTVGHPVVTEVYPSVSQWPAGLKEAVIGLEGLSGHPLAKAVEKYLVENPKNETYQRISTSTNQHIINSFHILPGLGVKAKIGALEIAAGNIELVKALGAEPDPGFSSLYEKWAAGGATPLYIVCEGRVEAIMALEDQIRPDAAPLIKHLLSKGIRVVMLTGDNAISAGAIGKRAGIIEIVAGVKPLEKADFVKSLIAEGNIVSMAGDGINDAAALATASVGIAMGTGTGVAIESGQVVIMNGAIGKIALAIDISWATMKTVRQNLFWAFFYNIISIPVAAGALFALTGLMFSPMLAGAAMSFSSISVMVNSLLLKKKKVF